MRLVQATLRGMVSSAFLAMGDSRPPRQTTLKYVYGLGYWAGVGLWIWIAAEGEWVAAVIMVGALAFALALGLWRHFRHRSNGASSATP
jgi:hypothetical protein